MPHLQPGRSSQITVICDMLCTSSHCKLFSCYSSLVAQSCDRVARSSVQPSLSVTFCHPRRHERLDLLNGPRNPPLSCQNGVATAASLNQITDMTEMSGNARRRSRKEFFVILTRKRHYFGTFLCLFTEACVMLSGMHIFISQAAVTCDMKIRSK